MSLVAGLTWDDETTQKVLTSELSKLRRIPIRTLQNGPGRIYSTDGRLETSSPVTFTSYFAFCFKKKILGVQKC